MPHLFLYVLLIIKYLDVVEMVKNKFVYFFVISLLVFSSFVIADDEAQVGESVVHYYGEPSVKTKISIKREHPETAFLGEGVEIKLIVKNDFNESLDLVVSEFLISGVEYLDSNIQKLTLNYEGLPVSYYTWKFTLPAFSSKELVYHVKFKDLGLYSFSPASVSDQYGNKADSEPTSIIIKCNTNGVCEKGESHLFCPEDCPTGVKDDNCDALVDGKCDPDCVPSYDPDCSENAGNKSLSSNCSSVVDEVCDENCMNFDPDCNKLSKKSVAWENVIAISVIILLVIALAFYFYKRGK